MSDPSSERIEKLLAILVLQTLRGQPQREKVLALNLAGFSNIEVADLLQTSSQVVAQHLYDIRKRSKLGKPASKRAT